MKTTEEALEFDQIEQELMTYFRYQENAESFHDEKMIIDSLALDTEHRFLKETNEYFSRGYVISLLHVNDLSDHLALLSKKAALSIKGLSDFRPFLDNIETFSLCFCDKKFLPSLFDLMECLKTFRYISQRIDQAILPDLSVSDDASEALYDIRQKIKNAYASINTVIKGAASKYSPYLAQSQEVMKEGLPTLAVTADYKSKVKGLVADISHTGNTVFIIPLEILDIQNKIYSLKEDERTEIERILKALSQLLIDELEGINKDYAICLRMDSLIARVQFGLSYKGVVGENADFINIEDLAHPLLNLDTVVRNTIHLGGTRADILVISGPNAGGKTVLIKAVALACYMNQRGLLVASAGKAQLKLFDKIFFLSGDTQSIMDNLSTFSGHISSINEALSQVGPNSLFVVDEIGQGTSPLDGEAIGTAVIDYLEKIGCYAILTSHYEGLKEKAVKDEKCLVGAMIFDESTIKPTFRYREGMIGKSYAIEVAINLGMNPEIVADAKKYIDEKSKTPEKVMMKKLQELQDDNIRLKDEYEKRVAQAADLEEKKIAAIAALNRERQEIFENANDKVDKIIDGRINEIDAIYRSDNTKIDLQAMAQMKGALNKIRVVKDKNINPENDSEEELHVGDKVKVASMNNNGVISSIDQSGKSISVNFSGIILKTNRSDLTKICSSSVINKPKISTADKYIERKTGIPMECNLIGLYSDEARVKLDKYLDDCILMKFHQVRIIHGNGSGALRNMVRRYLESNSNVDSFRFGGAGEGGVGCTVVTLK